MAWILRTGTQSHHTAKAWRRRGSSFTWSCASMSTAVIVDKIRPSGVWNCTDGPSEHLVAAWANVWCPGSEGRGSALEQAVLRSGHGRKERLFGERELRAGGERLLGGTGSNAWVIGLMRWRRARMILFGTQATGTSSSSLMGSPSIRMRQLLRRTRTSLFNSRLIYPQLKPFQSG
eukprot:5639642-Amphidinium_carterae.1